MRVVGGSSTFLRLSGLEPLSQQVLLRWPQARGRDADKAPSTSGGGGFPTSGFSVYGLGLKVLISISFFMVIVMTLTIFVFFFCG